MTRKVKQEIMAVEKDDGVWTLVEEPDIFYAYATKDGDILMETISDLKSDLWRKLYRCFPLSYKKQKKHYRLAEVEIRIVRIIDEKEEK